MSKVLSDEKRQQVIALGRLGWPLRRIEKETGVRRETAGAYLKARADRLLERYDRRAMAAAGIDKDQVNTRRRHGYLLLGARGRA